MIYLNAFNCKNSYFPLYYQCSIRSTSIMKSQSYVIDELSMKIFQNSVKNSNKRDHDIFLQYQLSHTELNAANIKYQQLLKAFTALLVVVLRM